MIEKTEAIVLRIAPFSRTSHVVTWFTGAHGRVVTMIKGACRPKSMFLGQYDLFYTCELLYYMKEHNGIHIAKECCPLNTRGKFRSDWRAAACASYACDLVSRCCHDEHEQPEVFQLLTTFLDFLTVHGGKRELMFWFEISLAGLMGFAPNIARCSTCHGEIPPGISSPLSYQRGGLICTRCASASGEATEIISSAALAILRTWQGTDSPRAARNTACSTAQTFEIQKLLGNFLYYHLDIMPPSRYIALQLLAG